MSPSWLLGHLHACFRVFGVTHWSVWTPGPEWNTHPLMKVCANIVALKRNLFSLTPYQVYGPLGFFDGTPVKITLPSAAAALLKVNIFQHLCGYITSYLFFSPFCWFVAIYAFTFPPPHVFFSKPMTRTFLCYWVRDTQKWDSSVTYIFKWHLIKSIFSLYL